MIRLTISITLVLLLVAGSLWAGSWKVDNTHSSIQFTIRHLVVSSVGGSFSDFSGTVDWDGDQEHLAEGRGELVIDVASISTGNENRDEHLRKADFFDVEKFPSITFAWSKFIPGEGDKFQLVGDMSMKGISKEVTFDCVFNGQVEHKGRKRSGFSASAVIDRTEFGMEGAGLLEGGGLTLSDDVKVNMDLAFVYIEEEKEKEKEENKEEKEKEENKEKETSK